MGFDLSSLIEPVVGLDILTKPFEKEEMEIGRASCRERV